MTIHEHDRLSTGDGSGRRAMLNMTEPSAWRWEGVKSLLGLGLLYQQQGNWFQLDNFIPGLSLFVGLWLLISPAVTAYFCYAPAESPDLQGIKAKAA